MSETTNNTTTQTTEDLIRDAMLRLSGKVLDEELGIICDELRMCMQDYTVSKIGTELAVYESLPKEYEIFLVAKKIEGRRMGTLELYKIRLEDFFHTTGKQMKDITSNDIRIYLYQLQKNRNMSDRTLDSCRLVLNGFFKWCWEEGYIEKNPCASIRPIHYEAKPREPLSDIEMETFRKGCITYRDSAIVETLYSTGCRCSELCNLNREDIDLETREVKLFGKGKKHRSSYLSARGVIAVKDYIRSRTDNNEALFVTTKKPYKRLKNGGIEWIVTCIAKRAGVEDVYPHRIRHTFATDALGRGMDVTDLQALLGHSSVDTTLIYAKVNSDEVANSHHKYIG